MDKDNSLETIVNLLGKWSVGNEPLYQLLAAALKQAIREQYLLAGSRLPPERKVANALAISRSTVVAAYDVLRQEELVESRQGSGTVIKVLKGHKDNEILTGFQSKLSRQFKAEVPGYRKLEMVDFATGTIQSLKAIVKKASKLTSEELNGLLGGNDYTQSGLPVLRQNLARWFTETGLPTDENQILITTGTQQAVTLLAQLYTRRGDVVALDNPSFLGTIDIFKAAGTRLSGISFSNSNTSNDTRNSSKGTKNVLDSDSPEKLIRQTSPRLLYLMPTFQNPTGFVLPAAQRQRLAVLSEELQLPIIEDHTLSFFELDNIIPPPKQITGFGGRDNKVFVVGSLSKLFWAGLRIGWIRGTASTIESLTRLKVVSDLGSPILDQFIGARLIPEIRQAQKLRARQLSPRKLYLQNLLKRKLPDWEWNEPEGGLFLWVKLPKGSANELAQLALRNGVILMPGNNLSVDGSYANYLRLPFFLEPFYMEEGIDRIVTTWQRYS